MSKSKNKLKLAVEKKEMLLDVGKDFLGWMVVTAISFIYSVVFLLFLSLIFLNIWKVTFDQILTYSTVITVVCSLAYMGKIIYQRIH